MFYLDCRRRTLSMENKNTIVVFLIAFAIKKAFLLSGKGVCKERNGDGLKCCYGHIERGSFCIPCPDGYYGYDCARICPANSFGEFCTKMCQCTDKEICHPVHGCMDKSVYLDDNSTTTTTTTTTAAAAEEASYDTKAMVSRKVTSPCLTQDEGFKITYADMITYGALFAIIVLVVTNIVISKTHVMEVKHEIYPIIEDCYGSIVSKPKISGKKLARESKRQIAKQLSAMIDKSRSRDADYQNVELAGGFMNNLNIEPKTKQTVMEDFQSIAHDYIPENVMDNKEYFSIDEV